MRLVLATPLYPPEIADPAPYVKELAKRLGSHHSATIVTYGRLPEIVPGVKIIAIDKRRPLPLRLIAFFFALLHAARNADILYIQNGPSVELPAWLVALATRTPLVVHIGDAAAHAYAQQHGFRRILERTTFNRAHAVIDASPIPRPEIMPLEAPPTALQTKYEESWRAHLELLTQTFNHASE